MVRVSGILPIKNGDQWIARSLPRILANLDSEDELIVIDDGSSDLSYKLVMSFAESDNRIKLHRTKGVGLVESLNLGISESISEWVARFDIDDFYSRDRLKMQKENIDESLVAIFSDYQILHNGKSNLGIIPSPITDSATTLSLLRSQRTAHPSALIRKSSLIKVGGYLQSEYPAEDLGLWTRLAEVGMLTSIPLVGLYYNMRAGSISRENKNLIAQKREIILNAFIKVLDMDYVYSNLEKTIDTYKKLERGRERTLLHYWDLTHSQSQKLLGKARRRDVKRRLGLAVSNPLNSVANTNLMYYRYLRKLYK
jgi:glycosyltransferase involved in cell wall biosynthesis